MRRLHVPEPANSAYSAQFLLAFRGNSIYQDFIYKLSKGPSVLKRINTKHLEPGMYVVQYGEGSFSSPVVRPNRLVEKPEEIDSIISEALTAIIDTRLGKDAPADPGHQDAAVAADLTQPAPTQGEAKMVNEVIPPIIEAGVLGPSPMVALRDEITVARHAYNRALDFMSRFLRDIKMNGDLRVDEAHQLSEDIAQSSRRNHRAVGAIPIIRAHGHVSHHCVNVAFIAAAFARHVGLGDAEAQRLTLAGLMHDVGKALIPDSVMHKPGRLTQQEMALMRRHPELGHNRIKGLGLHEDVMRAVLEHHERCDGSGYPLGLKGDAVAPSAKRISLFDVYDALISYRTYRRASTPLEALRFLYKHQGVHFCAKTVTAFIRFIGVYPIGSFVKMADGSFGLVTDFREDSPLKPTVKLVFDSRLRPIRQSTMDLSDEKNGQARIVCSVNPKDLKIDTDLLFP